MTAKPVRFDSFTVTSECMGREDCIDSGILRRVVKNVETSDKSYHELLQKAMQVARCTEGAESCVLKYLQDKQLIQPGELQQITPNLKPFGPRNSQKWLSDSDIDNICRLFEKDYPTYKHLGIVMSDLVVVRGSEGPITPELIARLAQQGKRMFSIVFNTDVSTNNGQHWFCVFIEMASSTECKSIELFDSQRNGDEIKCTNQTSGEMGAAATQFSEGCSKNARVTKVYDLCRRIQSSFTKQYSGGTQQPKVVVVTDGDLQKEGSECGVYSIYYIYNRLKGHFDGTPFSEGTKIEDSQMLDFRKNLFRGFKLK